MGGKGCKVKWLWPDAVQNINTETVSCCLRFPTPPLGNSTLPHLTAPPYHMLSFSKGPENQNIQ
jgi:hypothetical protein